MAIIALLMWTLVALGHARIYERCELARTLSGLGVDKEHLATWVCIAYHESRFDTAARNPYSGDHGLLQISELYWCGSGKACGIPCSALRDEDISDDIQCANQIYKEHTRLQGDGFMAWVVYSHHCKHNAKKYLADCEESLKDVSVSVSFSNRARSMWNERRNVSTVKTYYPDIDQLKPPYLAINSLLESRFANNNKESTYWQNYKIDNIDSLKLPVFNNDGAIRFISPPTTTNSYKLTITTTNKPTTTTIDPYLIGIKPPMPRKIESNQFRRKKIGSNKNQIIDTEVNSDSMGMYSQSTPTLKQLLNKPDNIEQYSITSSSDAYKFSKTSIPYINDKQEISTIKNENIDSANQPLETQKTVNPPISTSPFNRYGSNNYNEPFTPYYNKNSQNGQSSVPSSNTPRENVNFSRIENITLSNPTSNILHETKSKGLNGYDFSFKNLTENMKFHVSYKNMHSSGRSRSQFSSSTSKLWPYNTQTTVTPHSTTWSWRSPRPSTNSVSEITSSSSKNEEYGFFKSYNVSTQNPGGSSKNIILSSDSTKTSQPSTRSWRFSSQLSNNPVTTQKTVASSYLLSATTATPSPWSWGFSRQTQRMPTSVTTTVSPNYMNRSTKNITSEFDLPKSTTPSSRSWGFSRRSQSNSLVTTTPPNRSSVIISTESVPSLNWSSNKISGLNLSKTIKPNWNYWEIPHTAETKSVTTTTSSYPFFKTDSLSRQRFNGFKNITTTDLNKTPQPSTRSWRYSRPSNNPIETTTSKPSTTTSIYRWTAKKSIPISVTQKITEVTKLQETSTTAKPSIFDLYLRPGKGTPYAPYQFSSFNNSRRFQIFAGGTTGSPNSRW